MAGVGWADACACSQAVAASAASIAALIVGAIAGSDDAGQCRADVLLDRLHGRALPKPQSTSGFHVDAMSCERGLDFGVEAGARMIGPDAEESRDERSHAIT